jgi:hypothetical protein
MWLLDVNLPKKIRALLRELGIEAHCAGDRGWGGLSNGALVEAVPGRMADLQSGSTMSANHAKPARDL